MKTPIKLITAVFALIIVGAIVTIQAQQAAPQPSPLPVIVNPAPKQYRVIDIGRINVGLGQTPVATLEAILNEMGAHGWKVVATSGSFVIMMQ